MNGESEMRRWACCFAAFMLSMPLAARADTFEVFPGTESKVVFTSRAPMETFQGKTNRIEGKIVVDPTSLGDSVTVDFAVDLASLDTGINKRNEHMRKNHLETDKYPKAVFTGATVLDPKTAHLEPGKTVPIDIEGTFTLHGVSRRLRTTVEVGYVANGGASQLKFRTGFKVKLSDYDIRRPEFLFLKLADAQDVQVSGMAVSTERSRR